jgi:hypothetical protein
MSKKSQRKRKQSGRQPRPRWFSWLWLAVAGVALLVAGALVLLQTGSGDEPQVTPLVVGAPRLAVDRAIVDEGYIKYDVPIRTTFRLSNVGDQPLKILNQPQVWLVKGC